MSTDCDPTQGMTKGKEPIPLIPRGNRHHEGSVTAVYRIDVDLRRNVIATTIAGLNGIARWGRRYVLTVYRIHIQFWRDVITAGVVRLHMVARWRGRDPPLAHRGAILVVLAGQFALRLGGFAQLLTNRGHGARIFM